MITEEQRRALFALREALHLCDVAGVLIVEDEHNGIEVHIGAGEWPCGPSLVTRDIVKLLAEYPEQ